jgi:hypothetical protein
MAATEGAGHEHGPVAPGRVLAYVAGFGAAALVLSPLLTRPADSFPVSTYPMFARRPGILVLYSVVAAASDGSEQRLSPGLVGSGEVLQTKALIARSVELGPAAMAELCQNTAERVAASMPEARVRYVDIVRRNYDPVAYFVSGPTPISQERLFRCGIPEPAAAPVPPATPVAKP